MTEQANTNNEDQIAKSSIMLFALFLIHMAVMLMAIGWNYPNEKEDIIPSFLRIIGLIWLILGILTFAGSLIDD